MKVRRTIGGALFGIGCAVTFVGILATVLPMVQNDQLQLVLSSFEMPSGNLIVSAVNGAMTYALHHCYGVLLCGIQITSGLSRLGMNPVAAKVIADGVMFAASYQVQQRIVFRSRRP